jgi:class 3 adenylate cyclase/tetratricopeptide (TPR) repeat protein
MRCAHCHADNPSGARFCGQCGQALASACPACGAAVTAEQRFCNACGHDLQRAVRSAELPSPALVAPAGAAIAAPAPGLAPEDAERRQATVVFADLAGYTALAETHDPEDVEALLARIKAAATEVIERHGGTVNQFVGDEVMALFGVPVAHRDDARHAVAAALELDASVRRLLSAERQGEALALHTGISTGLVVVRRSDARAGAWTCTGDTVNVAARLRSLAGAGDVLVAPDTWRQVAEAYEGDALAPVELKGKERPLVPYRVRAPRAAPLGEGPMVGRDEELQQFSALAGVCLERQRGRVVVMRGDPGVGKSRLVREFLLRASEAGFAAHASTVLDFGSETGRDAIRSLARSLSGLPAHADEALRLESAQRIVAEHALEPEAQLLLRDLLDVAPGAQLQALSDAMSTRAREQGSIAALCDLVRRRGAERPLAVAVEDIHWADAWTLERIAALANLAARQALLLILTTRFAGDPTAGAWRTSLHGAPLVAIDLGPLDEADALRLASATSTMPEPVIRSCVARAEGNALFLLQLLVNAGEVAQAQLPGSIQALVHARMDRLAPPDKAALQAAAVLGQRYALDALRHLLEQPRYDGDVLVEQFLVRRDAAEFMFCHALIRDGAYASLLHARRRVLHARAATWFESSEPALAAEHYERAGHPDAPRAYLRAADAAATQQRPTAALALVERGIELAASRDVRLALLMARARLLVELGRAGDAVEAGRAALAIAEDASERAQALVVMASGMRLNDRIGEGLAALNEAEPLAQAAGLRAELARLHHLRGNLLFPLGRADECLRAHQRALDEARAAGSLELETAALGGLGDAHYLQGRMRTACEQFKACIALARAQRFGRLEVANLPMVGWTRHHLREIDPAIETANEAIEMAGRAEQPRARMLGLSLYLWVTGLIICDNERADRAVALAQQLFERLGARRFEAQARSVVAVMAWRTGDRPRAREQARVALEICRAHGMAHTGAWVLAVCGLVDPDPDARRRWLGEAESELARGAVAHNHLSVRDLQIEVSLDLGDWHEVDAACDRLRAYTSAEPLPLWELRIARGRALARHGRGERGIELAATLARLREEAAAAQVASDLPALDRALAEQRRSPAGAHEKGGPQAAS